MNELGGLRGRIGIVMDKWNVGLPAGGLREWEMGERGGERRGVAGAAIEMSVSVDGVGMESVWAGRGVGVVGVAGGGAIEVGGIVGDCEGGHC